MEINQLFLQAVEAFLQNRMVDPGGPVSAEEWNQLLLLARKQHVLPMVYQSVSRTEAFRSTAAGLDQAVKPLVYREVMEQVRKSQAFLSLYRALSERGLEPLVVKGIVLRSLYPDGDSRPSGDEDLYIPADSYAQYREALLENGMEIAPMHVGKEEALHEVTYCQRGGSLMIELHKSLFSRDDPLFEELNKLFEPAFARSVRVDAGGVAVRTLSHSDHMLFLILHAYKHFITGGFGVRQVCDMAVFANAYGAEIDWAHVYEGCRLIDAEIFAASLFEIGRMHFAMDYEKARYPQMWRELGADPQALLEDLLDAGIYGASDMNRKHSSSITVEAVAAYRSGRKMQNGVLKSLFPSLQTLQGRYGYLIRYPFLLPAAWVSRLAQYGWKLIRGGKGDSASAALKMGGERVELLKKYGIIRD